MFNILKINIGVHAKSLQSYLTLCDTMDHIPLGSSVHGILQAGMLEWVSMPYSRDSSQPRDCGTQFIQIVQ